jgi:hypothetical protein
MVHEILRVGRIFASMSAVLTVNSHLSTNSSKVCASILKLILRKFQFQLSTSSFFHLLLQFVSSLLLLSYLKFKAKFVFGTPKIDFKEVPSYGVN